MQYTASMSDFPSALTSTHSQIAQKPQNIIYSEDMYEESQTPRSELSKVTKKEMPEKQKKQIEFIDQIYNRLVKPRDLETPQQEKQTITEFVTPLRDSCQKQVFKENQDILNTNMQPPLCQSDPNFNQTLQVLAGTASQLQNACLGINQICEVLNKSQAFTRQQEN